MVNHTGCTVYWDKTSFPIIVSPDSTFTKVDIASAYAAIEIWNGAVGQKVFVLHPGLLQQKISLEGVEMSHAELQAPWVGYCPVVSHDTLDGRLGRIWRGGCLLDKNRMKDSTTYVMVIVHELGHALGFTHDVDISSIMYAQVDQSDKKFMTHHLDTVRDMMNGTYKRRTASDMPSCF